MKKLNLIVCLVFISLVSMGQTTLVLQPGAAEGKDADIRDDQAAVPNSTSPDFIANAWTASGSFIQRSLVEFDLSSIPAGAVIVSATLSLFSNPTSSHYQHHSSLSGSNECFLRRITEEWLENTVCWNNQPATTTQNEIILPQASSQLQNYPSIDVTDLIKDMILDPANSHGFMMRLVTESYYRCMSFSSSDHIDPSLHPKLTIIYYSCSPPTANFSTIVNNLSVNFINQSSGAVSWLWNFGDGFTSILQNPTHVYLNAGTYYVCLTAISDSCGSVVYCDSIIVCESPVAQFSYANTYLTVQFTNLSANYSSCEWDLGDGTFTTLTNPTHSYLSNAIYTVCLTTYNICSADTICQEVNLLGPGIPEQIPEKYSVYPSPAKETVYIKSPFDAEAGVKLFAPDGRLLLVKHISLSSNTPATIDISAILPGCYLLSMEGKGFLYHDIVLKN